MSTNITTCIKPRETENYFNDVYLFDKLQSQKRNLFIRKPFIRKSCQRSYIPNNPTLSLIIQGKEVFKREYEKVPNKLILGKILLDKLCLEIGLKEVLPNQRIKEMYLYLDPLRPNAIEIEYVKELDNTKEEDIINAKAATSNMYEIIGSAF